LNVALNTINLIFYLQRHIPTYLSIYIFTRIIDFIQFLLVIFLSWWVSNFHNQIYFTSHTIYVAKFEQRIIQQQVHWRRESQSHAPVHVLMRWYPIDKSKMENSFSFWKSAIFLFFSLFKLTDEVSKGLIWQTGMNHIAT
jgi:hypothetical protein